jgi:hypothetical protein
VETEGGKYKGQREENWISQMGWNFHYNPPFFCFNHEFLHLFHFTVYWFTFFYLSKYHSYINVVCLYA